jgi:hypothetical protein
MRGDSAVLVDFPQPANATRAVAEASIARVRRCERWPGIIDYSVAFLS